MSTHGFTDFRFFLLVILFELNMLYRRTVSIFFLPILCFHKYTKFTLNQILKREESVRRFNQVHNKVGATRKKYIANKADNNKCEGIKLSNPKQ